MTHTRFKGDQAQHYASLRDAADAYPKTLTPAELVGLWQKPFDWSEGHVGFLDNMYQLLNAVQAMRLKPAATIVEVGSGAGWTTEILAALGYRVVCLEPAEAMLDGARQRVTDFLHLRRMPELIPNVAYHSATLEEADFLEDGLADGMLFFESFHHIIDEHKAVAEAFRILKPQGCLCILGDSNWRPGDSAQEQFWREEMERFGTLESPFTHQYMEQVFRTHGFTEVRRHHAVNTFIPVEDEQRPVRAFIERLDALHLNLFVVRKTEPATDAHESVSTPGISPTAPDPTPATLLGSTSAMAMARRIYHQVPVLQPIMRHVAKVVRSWSRT